MDKEKLQKIKDIVAEAVRKLDEGKREDPFLGGASSLADTLWHHLCEFDDPLDERMLHDEERDVFMRMGKAFRELTAYYGIDTKEALSLMMWPPEKKGDER